MKRKGKLSKNKDAKEAQKDSARAKKRRYPGKKRSGQAMANLGGFIFMCNSSTKADCFKYKVFGLGEGKKDLVAQVRKGLRLFLFDVDSRLLYGIYIAASPGVYKLENDAFGGAFPWQVRFSIQKDCLPLSEDIFRAAIKENYLDDRKFKIELTIEQVDRLVKLFRPLPGGPERSPPRAKYETNYPPSDQLLAEKPSAQYLTKYAHLYPSDERRVVDVNAQGIPPRSSRESIHAADDLYLGRELRLQQGLAQHNPIGVGSLSAYSADPLRPLSDLRLPRAGDNKNGHPSDERRLLDVNAQGIPPRSSRESIHAADDLYLGRELRLQQGLARHNLIGVGSLSAYSADPLRPLSDLRLPRAGDNKYSFNMLGADVEPVYQSRLQATDVWRDIFDRRVPALNPLSEGFVNSGDLSSQLLPGRIRNETYATGYGASGLSYRGELLPHSRYYGGSGF